MNPLNAHSLPSTSFISQQHSPTTTPNHTPIPRPLNFEAASNRWVFPSTSRRTIPRPLPNPTGAGHIPVAATLLSPSLVIIPPQPSAVTYYPTSKTESASLPLARKRPLPGLPSSAEDALTSRKPTLARLPISSSEPRKQRHDIFASAVPPPRRGRLPEGGSLLTLSPISPASDPESVLQHQLRERDTLVNEQASSHHLEFDLAAINDNPLMDHEDKDGCSSVCSLSPIRYARPLPQEYETGTSSPIWEQNSTEWDGRISPLHFPQMDSDQSGDESDDLTEAGGRRSVSLNSHVQRPGRQQVGSDENRASSATPRSKESEATRSGLGQTEMPLSAVIKSSNKLTLENDVTETTEESTVLHSQRYLRTILEHRKVALRKITRDALSLEHRPPAIVWNRWNETQHGKQRMPLDPIIERCERVADKNGLEDINKEMYPWYYVQWHYPGLDAHSSDERQTSSPQAVVIYSAVTLEILPLQDSCWVLDLHSSESLRDLVLAGESINLTGIEVASLSEARAVMILLDYVLSCFQWCARHLRRLHRAIRTITTTFGEQCLPPAFYLSGVLHDGNDAIGGGGYSDTFKGTLGKKVVCLKVPRVFVSSGPTERKKSLQVFLDEAIIWRHLRHPNVLPFLGISQNAFAHRTCFVSPFMANGDLMQFLKRNPGHDRIVCLYEIAKGLQYLHASYIYHGDVKGANVLVDDNNCCRLADFGITFLISTNTATTNLATITSTKGSNRWMVPEVFDPASYKNSSRVRAAPRDVYAFACTSLEVMTGKPPFPELPEPAAMVSVLQGERPERPQQIECLTDVLWNLIERCWAQKPEARPTFDGITITMGGVINQERT